MKINESHGVWVDVFELSRFRGKRRRLFGPARFSAVRSRAADWGICIDSLLVGPQAYVRLFCSKDTDGHGLWLLPMQGVEDLVEFRAGDELDSVIIQDRPPERGEKGYAGFLLARSKQKPAAESRGSDSPK